MLRTCFLRTTLFVVALGALPAAAPAQTTSNDCTAQVPPQTATPGEKPDSGSLTGKLDNCNGVLTPPAVGDGDIVEPAPQTGQTPVIKPNDLPQDGNPAPQP